MAVQPEWQLAGSEGAERKPTGPAAGGGADQRLVTLTASSGEVPAVGRSWLFYLKDGNSEAAAAPRPTPQESALCPHPPRLPHRHRRRGGLAAGAGGGMHQASTKPAPGQDQARTRPAPGQHRASTGPAPDQHQASTEQHRPGQGQHQARTGLPPDQHQASTKQHRPEQGQHQASTGQHQASTRPARASTGPAPGQHGLVVGLHQTSTGQHAVRAGAPRRSRSSHTPPRVPLRARVQRPSVFFLFHFLFSFCT